MNNGKFRVGLTTDRVDEKIRYAETAWNRLEEAEQVEIVLFEADRVEPVKTAQLDEVDVLISGGVRCSRETLIGSQRCAGIIRYGAGFDTVDVEACTEAGVILGTTPLGIRRPMATAALTHILALATMFISKRQLIYDNRWTLEVESSDQFALGLTGRTVGFVGFGNIGTDLHALLQPFETRNLVFDPYLREEVASKFDIECVDLDTLLGQSDYVVVVCALTDETRRLIGAKELGMMKSSAYLVNVARGPILDQRALVDALKAGAIRGAGLDAFDPEPIADDDPLMQLDNVNLTPHTLGMSDEMVRLCSELCVEGALDIMQGRPPGNVINREVLEDPRVQARLESFRKRFT